MTLFLGRVQLLAKNYYPVTLGDNIGPKQIIEKSSLSDK